MKKQEVLEMVIKCIPYPEHISDIDLEFEKNAIRFTWRTTSRFRVSFTDGNTLHVEESRDSFLEGSNIAILLERILWLELIKRELGREK